MRDEMMAYRSRMIFARIDMLSLLVLELMNKKLLNIFSI